MITTTDAFNIPQTAEKIFQFISTIENHTQFLPLERAEQITPGDVQVGTHFKHVPELKALGELEFEVTEFDKNRRIAFTALNGPFEASVTYKLTSESDGNSTRFVREAHARPKGILKIIFPLVRPMVRQQFARDAQTLESVLRNLD